MGDIFIDIAEILNAAGCWVAVNDINAGWETRSRSSGGFNANPLGVQWHHTASKASVNSDLGYMINGSPDEPVGNVLLDRDGVFWPVAAGCANTSGKGGPNQFSRGTCPKDSGNTVLFSIEIANNGVGEQYTQAQIDAAFKGSNAFNKAFGNQPTDVVTHSLGAGDGYTDRKIDPATVNIAGPWRPDSVNSSQTWSQADLRAECQRRAGDTPEPEPGPTPTPNEEINMLGLDLGEPGKDDWWTRLTYTGSELCHVVSPADQLQARGKVPIISVSEPELSALLDSVQTIGPSPFYAGGQAPNADLHRKWETARGRT